MEELIAANQLFVFSSLEKCPTLENGVFNEEKSYLEKQYPSGCCRS